MPLSTLPPEVLLLILSHLAGIDIENVAKTFNKALTPLCLPLVQHRVDFQRNKKHMMALFPLDRDQVFEYNPKKCYELLGLEEEWGPFVDLPGRDKEMYLDYMDFDGTLDWLDLGPQKHVERDAKDIERVRRYDEAARICGFALPEGFRTMLLDRKNVLEAMFGTAVEGGCETSFGDTMFVKARWLKKSLWTTGNDGNDDNDENDDSEDDDSERRAVHPDFKWKLARQCEEEHKPDDFAEGYLLTFVGDQQGCSYTYLFVDDSDRDGKPRCCVLGSSEDPCLVNHYGRSRSEPDEEWAEFENVGLTKPVERFGKEKVDRACLVKGDWIQISVTKEMAEVGIWPFNTDGYNVLRPHAYSFDEFIAACWFRRMEFSIFRMKGYGKPSKAIPCPPNAETYRQHLIDIYSTKGRKNGWTQGFRPLDASKDS